MTQTEFVKKFLPYARNTQAKIGIDARFTLAQSALETGWGAKTPGNMMFGIKSKAAKNAPDDKKQLIWTTEVFSDDKQGYRFPKVKSIVRRADGKYVYTVQDWFEKYATPEESFDAHGNFFCRNPRYAKALAVMHDPYKFAEEVAKAGYATGTNYAAKLKSLIKTIDDIIVKNKL